MGVPVICLFALKSILSFLVLVYMTKVDAANNIRRAPLLSGYFMSLLMECMDRKLDSLRQRQVRIIFSLLQVGLLVVALSPPWL